ncbi:hypothetical protein ADIS_3737 [Lunatimonas lonarensis]|uniref:DUF1684 domain-containing protein n=1 Tax=Lunatimonas lonarensis TaxID=1232681 RepID=R7ZP00_9BACT|nr:DUF1684 domain-containing protein [Lunatimonas lonarensis]EON75846.1 hypothetical protein ADIS_3737 [Lunatimonas lonarensis]
MSQQKIVLLFIAVVVFGSILYTFVGGGEQTEQYIERIEKERERQFKYLKYNQESPLTEAQKRELDQLDFYPVDPGFLVKARIEPIEIKKMIEVPLTDGSVEKYLRHSFAVFELDGRELRLLLLQAAKEADKRNFFLAFADATSGEETYGGGRFLNLRQDGQRSITIDFNLAYNPYCAYNPDYACPIPPRENILEVPIRAGEKNYTK